MRPVSQLAPLRCPMLSPAIRNALAGAGALLLGLGIGRFGYTPLMPVLIENHWLSVGAAGYLGATNLFGYVFVGHCVESRQKLRRDFGPDGGEPFRGDCDGIF